MKRCVCVCVCRHHFINNYSFGVAWWIDRFDDEWIRYCCFSLKFIDWWPKDTHWLYLCYVYLFKLLDQFDRRRAAIVLHLSYLTFLDGKYGNQCQNGRFNWTLKSSMRSISFDKNRAFGLEIPIQAMSHELCSSCEGAFHHHLECISTDKQITFQLIWILFGFMVTEDFCSSERNTQTENFTAFCTSSFRFHLSLSLSLVGRALITKTEPIVNVILFCCCFVSKTSIDRIRFFFVAFVDLDTFSAKWTMRMKCVLIRAVNYLLFHHRCCSFSRVLQHRNHL